jgi:hypothetical protein
MVVWTSEEIAKRTTEDIKALRENAHRQKREDIVALCDVELEKRKPSRQNRIAKGDNRTTGQFVSEFHFVCPNELGVTRNSDGSIWTGTWVVAEDNAIDAEAYGSVVALHTNKAEPSYIQGTIKGWRRSPREKRYSEDQLVKTTSGIDFLFVPDKGPIPWKGDATGEKGYFWAAIPD